MFEIQLLRPNDEAEIEWVARHMRQTLVEVLGAERGEALYSLEWLRQRVLWHLDPALCTGRVFLLQTQAGEWAGHSIVRIERVGRGTEWGEERSTERGKEQGAEFGLFSTTYVEPQFRRLGGASLLLQHGESWMLEQGMRSAATDTAEDNLGLIRTFEKHGYVITFGEKEMVRLSKSL
jgi:GNAT superfamily N-acetyltransferase